MDKGPLCIHEIELMIQPRKHFSYRRGVANHAASPHDLGQISPRDRRWRLVVDPHLETRRTPVHELNRPFCLYRTDGAADVFGDNVSPIRKRASHIFSMPGVALCHLVSRFEDSVSQLGDTQLLVIGPFRTNDGGVGRERKVNARVRHQIGLKLIHVSIESPIETERSRQR